MLKAIQNNPFRVLGVYANSPKRDIVSNKGRMSAFLNVGREVTFPLDLQGILPTIQRDADIVANADSELSLPAGQLKHGQFWFVKTTPIDDIAFNHLLNGNIDNAIEMWGKRQCMSSLQNRVVAYLIKEEYRQAISCAQELYDSYSDELVTTIAGDTYTCTSDDLIHHFIDKLLEEKAVDPMLLFEIISHLDWVTYLKGKLVEPLIQQIESAINEAEKLRKKGEALICYQAGVNLMNQMKTPLKSLGELIPATDLKYQIVADKLAICILQCGIDYFNKIENDDNAPQKALTLQSYAHEISIGSIAKERCKENVEILKKIGKEYAVRNEISRLTTQIKNLQGEKKSSEFVFQLTGFSRREISEIDQIVNWCMPDLDTMKRILGYSNSLYLKFSSAVVSSAVNALVEIVNTQQSLAYGDNNKLRSVISNAIPLMRKIGQLDMDAKTRNYYNSNNSTLNSIHSKLNPSGCYIATMAYGDYNHPQVLILRNFRDTYLEKREWGRIFIKYYYHYSPKLVEKLKNHVQINRIIRKGLDCFIKLIK